MVKLNTLLNYWLEIRVEDYSLSSSCGTGVFGFVFRGRPVPVFVVFAGVLVGFLPVSDWISCSDSEEELLMSAMSILCR